MKAGRPSKDKKDALELSDVTDKPKKSTRVNFNLDEVLIIKALNGSSNCFHRSFLALQMLLLRLQGFSY